MVARALTIGVLLAAFAVPAGLAAAPCASAQAAGMHHAGLVVQMPAETKTFCVSFTAAEEAKGVTGVDLLERSGLNVSFGGVRSAATVCRIDGVGCTDPGRCFCDCPVASAPGCRFWGYYTLDAKNAWTFAQIGASARRVHDGDVDGWRYANHYTRNGAPAAATIKALCTKNAQAVSSVRALPVPRKRGLGGLLLAFVVAGGFAVALLTTLRRRRAEAS